MKRNATMVLFRCWDLHCIERLTHYTPNKMELGRNFIILNDCFKWVLLLSLLLLLLSKNMLEWNWEEIPLF